MKNKRIGVFIDGSNIWHCQKRNKWSIDYYKLKKFLSLRGKLELLSYFTPDAPHIKKFLDGIDAIGYSVIKKPIKKIKLRQNNKPVSFKYKGNLDMEMGLHMVANADKCDEFVIMSGDSDFEVVVKLLQSKGKNVVVISNKDSLSVEMKKVSNKVIYLHKIKEQIKYKKK